jgi:predicted DNA-binding protein
LTVLSNGITIVINGNTDEFGQDIMTKTISLKVPDALHKKLERFAKKGRLTKSDLIRTAIETYLNGEEDKVPVSFLAAAGKLLGCVEGPGDLSTNPKYMEGFGKCK